MIYPKASVSLLIAILVVIIFSCLHFFIAPVVGEEMRYMSVAWNMFLKHNWFVPQLGDAVYLHKTPLLFWCLDLGWWLKIDWLWQLILPIVFAVLAVFYTQKLSASLFPDKPKIIFLAPLLLVAMPFFINNLGILRFDMLLTWCNILACYHLTRASASRWHYWGFVVANGLGLLAKGPVIYMFTIPEALLFCLYFSDRPVKDATKLLMGVVVSMSALIIWWGPILYQGKAYLLHRMLFEQVVARATGSAGVSKPFWDYLPLLPCFFLPWVLFAPFLRKNSFREESRSCKNAARFSLQVFIVCLVLFSLLKTKESRYLLPVAPFVAIFIAYRLEKIASTFFRHQYVWSVGLMGLGLCCFSVALFVLLNHYPQKIHIFYAHYLPNVLEYMLFFMGALMMIGARLPIKSQVAMLLCISIGVSVTFDLATTYAISKTQDLRPAMKFINHLLLANIPVVSRDPVVLDMQFENRWFYWVPVIQSEKMLNKWIGDHPGAWIVTTADKKNIDLAYSQLANGCFEQSYAHLRGVITICPASTFLAIPRNEINVA